MVSTTPLFVNNICFAVVTACRLLRYLAGMKKNIRYGAAHGKPRQGVIHSTPVAQLRVVLSDVGYVFTADGGYGEKRDRGYIGTAVMYGGLLILLVVGIWDNSGYFSGILLDGMGPETNLNKAESYRSISKGPLAAIPTSLPRMRIINQHMPDGTYPRGATDIALISEDGTARMLTLKPGELAQQCGAYDLYMTKLVFEPEIVIRRPDSKPLFDSIVPLNPLVQKRGAYSFYGFFEGYNLAGGVYYQPEKSTLLVVVSRNGMKVVTEMAFQVDQQVKQGDFIVSCAKMGQWSEIHVVHRRHKGLLMLGGIAALMGLLLRITIRPQRVWLEEATGGCMVRISDKATLKLLNSVL